MVLLSSSVRFEGANPDSIFHDCNAGLDLVSVLLGAVSVMLTLISVSLGFAFVSLSFGFVSLGPVSVSLNFEWISFLAMVLLKTGYKVVMLVSGDVLGSIARIETVDVRSRIHGVNCKVRKIGLIILVAGQSCCPVDDMEPPLDGT